MSVRVLVENGQLVSEIPRSMKEFVLAKSLRGAYSGARTVERNKIFLFDEHVQRLGSFVFRLVVLHIGAFSLIFKYLFVLLFVAFSMCVRSK